MAGTTSPKFKSFNCLSYCAMHKEYNSFDKFSGHCNIISWHSLKSNSNVLYKTE